MKIEWLNDERTRALVTIGWFRKRQADVFLYCEGGNWYFSDFVNNPGTLGEPVKYEIQEKLNRARRKPPYSPWKPVGTLPMAKVVK